MAVTLQYGNSAQDLLLHVGLVPPLTAIHFNSLFAVSLCHVINNRGTWADFGEEARKPPVSSFLLRAHAKVSHV